MDIKWKTKLGWESIFQKYFLNRLRRDKNLSDLTNVANARANLGLVDDVTTHHHDSRYNSRFNQETAAREAKDAELENRIAALESSVKNLTTRIDTYISNNDKAVSDVRNLANNGAKVFVQSGDPGRSGNRLWVNTSTKRLYGSANGGAWIELGAVYL